MKFIYRHSATVLLPLLLILGACSKNLVETVSLKSDKSITVQEAKNYYVSTSENKNKNIRIGESPLEFSNIERTIKWEKSISKVINGQEIIITPLSYNKYRALRYSNHKNSNNKGLNKKDSHISLNETSFLYFYKDETGNIFEDVVTSVPTEEWSKNPTKRFSGYVIISDRKMNFKKGVVFNNGEVSGGFGISNSSKNGRTGDICGYIEQWGYNYSIDSDGRASDPTYIDYGTIPIYCTLAPDISPGYQIPTNSYDGTGYYYDPPAYVSEDAYFANNFISDPSDKTINNIQDYLKCFSNNQGSIYKLAVSVDQPIFGSSSPLNPFATGKHVVGHTFVTLTQVDSDGGTTQRTLGLYPLYGGSVTNPNVPSVFGNDSEYSGGWDVQLTFRITGNEMMQLVNFIPNYTNTNYDLSNRNCGNFGTDVLGQIGISVTPYWMNTYWYSVAMPYGGGSATEVRGASVGALGEQLYNTPPSRTTTKSHDGGDAPKNLGICN
jgi:hypothetical protein